MQMSIEEQKVYNQLSKEQKEDFRYAEKRHPNWSFTQVMAKVGFEGKISDVITDRKGDVDPNDKSLWQTILEGVSDFLDDFPILKEAAKAIRNAIGKIFEFVGDMIDDFFDWIF